METFEETSPKSRLRRFAEVFVPVAVFAVVVPLAVNGFAGAVGSSSTSTTAAPPTATVPLATAPPANITQEIVGSVIIETSVPALVEPQGTVPAANEGEGHSHGGITPEQPMSKTDRTELSGQLAQARSAAMKYPTVADAEADGYKLVTTYIPLIGAHYIKYTIFDTTFNVDEPEMLLYDGTNPDSSIVGLSYYVFSDTEPSPFAGPNDHWHQHIGLCIKNGVVVGGTQLTAAQCAARGGAKAGLNNGWMIHAWVVAGWESPQGVFSPEHPGLTAEIGNQ